MKRQDSNNYRTRSISWQSTRSNNQQMVGLTDHSSWLMTIRVQNFSNYSQNEHLENKTMNEIDIRSLNQMKNLTWQTMKNSRHSAKRLSSKSVFAKHYQNLPSITICRFMQRVLGNKLHSEGLFQSV